MIKLLPHILVLTILAGAAGCHNNANTSVNSNGSSNAVEDRSATPRPNTTPPADTNSLEPVQGSKKGSVSDTATSNPREPKEKSRSEAAAPTPNIPDSETIRRQMGMPPAVNKGQSTIESGSPMMKSGPTPSVPMMKAGSPKEVPMMTKKKPAETPNDKH